MNDHRQLIERLEALVDQDNHPDWEDVVRRAEAPAQEGRPVRTRRSKRSYLARRLVPVFVLAAAAFAFVLIAPWQHGPGATVMERALAAIGDRPVLHAVLRSPMMRTYIDLATGQEKPQFDTFEIWFDRERHLVHVKCSMDGSLYDDIREPLTDVSRSDLIDPALAEFFDGYRSALANGTAHVTGTGVVNGHEVSWIEIGAGQRPRYRLKERVAIDKKSSLPLKIEAINNGKRARKIVQTFEVALIETLPAGSGDFSKPKKFAREYSTARDQVTSITPSAAAAALPGALWVGERISTLTLSSVSSAALMTQEFSPMPEFNPLNMPSAASIRQLLSKQHRSAPSYQTGIELHYGDGSPGQVLGDEPTNVKPGGGFVWLWEAAKPDLNYEGGEEGASSASSMLTDCDASTHPVSCTGWLVKNGVHVTILTSSRELLLAAARALKPIDNGSSQATP
jgi:hypothetical protein